MEHSTELAHVANTLDHVVGSLFAGGVRGLSDGELVNVAVEAGALLRMVEGILVEATGALEERSSGPTEDRLDLKRGCRNATELIEKLTSASGMTIKRWKQAARVTRTRFGLTGAPLPAVFPMVREKMIAGHLGVDGVLAITKPLLPIVDRVSRDQLWAADAALGAIVDAGPAAFEHVVDGRSRVLPTAADELAATSARVSYLIDQDGAEPAEVAATTKRSLVIGKLAGGVVPIRGELLPEVAAVLQNLIDTVANPHGKPAGVRFASREEGFGAGAQDRPEGGWPASGAATDPDDPDVVHIERSADTRSRPQLAHDALATALNVAAASRAMPTMGGAAPTLVVTVDAETLASGKGWAQTRGYPVPLSVASHVSCGGTIQRIVVRDGKILQIATEERIFNARQRRAIAARDRECVIPGCHIPESWCEVHHITPWSTQQITDVNDGCLLCWYHHHFLERSGWQIRSRAGRIEIKAPPWLDGHGRWRPANTRVALVRTG